MAAMKPKILIVEDEPAITETIQYALETDGFETHCLSSGRPVISLLAKEAIDLSDQFLRSVLFCRANPQ